jgi:hypothetical protein
MPASGACALVGPLAATASAASTTAAHRRWALIGLLVCDVDLTRYPVSLELRGSLGSGKSFDN